jgi:hypothetical protein
MNKGHLDELLVRHKAQPVGHGYIDIIVNRDSYKSFVTDLILNGYTIESISWWEWCSGDKESDYGLGGPKSRYYDGWFSELSIDVDDIKVNDEKQIEEILDAIETKSISFHNNTATFKQNNWLTPGIWLAVPDDWRNEYCA